MSQGNKIYTLAGLLVLLGLVVYFNFRRSPAFVGTTIADTKFQRLDVPDPKLRLDLLEQIHKLEYTGTHRNIFSAAPPPMPSAVAQNPAETTPAAPPGPPPLDVPVTFYGYATQPQLGKRLAFFTNGDDVFVVAEGGILLNRFRLLHIGNNSAELEEISSGRRATLMLEQPAAGQP